MTIWEWINLNDGVIMVLITFVYVVATIFICVFNGRSASAAQKQIEESNKQQEQNVGVQLYSLRKGVLEQFEAKQYKIIRQDVTLLFNKEICIEFHSLMSALGKQESLESVFKEYWSHLRTAIAEEDRGTYAKLCITNPGLGDFEKLQQDAEEFCRFCNKYPLINMDTSTGETKTIQYRELCKEYTELLFQIGDQYVALTRKMQDFIKESIS